MLNRAAATTLHPASNLAPLRAAWHYWTTPNWTDSLWTSASHVALGFDHDPSSKKKKNSQDKDFFERATRPRDRSRRPWAIRHDNCVLRPRGFEVDFQVTLQLISCQSIVPARQHSKIQIFWFCAILGAGKCRITSLKVLRFPSNFQDKLPKTRASR